MRHRSSNDTSGIVHPPPGVIASSKTANLSSHEGAIRTDGIVNLELLIVFVQLELSARTSFSLDRGGEPCAFVLSNLAVGERRQGRHGKYCHRYEQSHEQVPPAGRGAS